MTKQEQKPVRTDLKPMLKIQDVERLLQIDQRTIRRLWKNGTLPAPLKIGHAIRWQADAIAAVLDSLGGNAK